MSQKTQVGTNVSQRQLDALISLAHTVAMWEKFGSDTELHDALSEHEHLLKPLIDLRDAQLRQTVHVLSSDPDPRVEPLPEEPITAETIIARLELRNLFGAHMRTFELCALDVGWTGGLDEPMRDVREQVTKLFERLAP